MQEWEASNWSELVVKQENVMTTPSHQSMMIIINKTPWGKIEFRPIFNINLTIILQYFVTD